MDKPAGQMEAARYFVSIPRFARYVRVVDKTPRYRIVAGRPYPHFCAYENLVLSCSGAIFKSDKPEEEVRSNLHECCNNYRGSKLIAPLFFNSNIGHDIVYEKDGLMTFDEKYADTIKVLALETNENLRAIRRIWGNIARLYTVDEVVKAAENEKLREEILLDTDLDRNLSKRFRHPLYWSLIIEYQWFGLYFGKQP